MKTFVDFLNADWGAAFINWKKRIDPVYIKSFLIVFAGAAAAYSFILFYFFMGNHDWTRMIAPFTEGYPWVGRFATQYPQLLLTQGQILPVITNLWFFIGVSLTAILLCIYWRVPKSVFVYSIIGLILALQPYTLALIASNNHLSLAWIYVCIYPLVAFLLSEKAIALNSKARKILYLSISTLLIFLSFATYQPIISMMAVVFLGRIAIDLFLDWDASFKSLKSILGRHKYLILSAICGVLLYEVVIALFFNLETSSYQNELVDFENMPSHILNMSIIAFKYLWKYPFAFFPSSLIRMFGILFYFSAFVVLFNVLTHSIVWGGGKKICVDGLQKRSFWRYCL
jgi:hypothetical protein